MSHSSRPLTCAYWGERPLCLLENSSFGLQWSCSWTWTHPEYFCTVKLMVAAEWSMSCLVSLILLHFYFHLAKASFSYILYFSQCRQRFFFCPLSSSFSQELHTHSASVGRKKVEFQKVWRGCSVLPGKEWREHQWLRALNFKLRLD